MPYLDINDLLLLKDSYRDYNVLIETGTGLGESICNLEHSFEKIYTIENDLYRHNIVSGLYDNKDITFLYGESVLLLKFIYTTINLYDNYKCIVYLDSYENIYERRKILLSELNIINKYFIYGCIIIIDGMRTTINNKKIDITIDEIIKVMKNRVSCFYFLIRNNIYNDRLVIHIKSISDV